MEQRHSPEPAPAFALNRTPDLALSQARIAAYLSRTCAPLFVSLPQEEAEQQRDEMQSHLKSMVAAHIELGASETEAVTLALQQFGKEHNVAQAWRKECEEVTAAAGRGSLWSALRPMAAASLVNKLVYSILLAVCSWSQGGPLTCCANAGQFGNLGLTIMRLEFIVVPIYLGFLAGRRVRGSVLAAALCALPVLFMSSGILVMRVYERLHLFVPPSHTDYHDLSGWNLVAYGVTFGMTLGFGALGAWAARWRRRRELRLAGSA